MDNFYKNKHSYRVFTIAALLLLSSIKGFSSCYSCFEILKVEIVVKNDTLTGYVKYFSDSYEGPSSGFYYEPVKSDNEDYYSLQFYDKGTINLYTGLDSLTYEGPVWQFGEWQDRQQYFKFFYGEVTQIHSDSIIGTKIITKRIRYGSSDSYGSERDISNLSLGNYQKIKKEEIHGIYILDELFDRALTTTYIIKFENRRIPEVITISNIEGYTEGYKALRELGKNYDIVVFTESGLD